MAVADESPSRSRTPTAASGLELLSVLAETGWHGLGVTELARATGFDVGQTHRMLKALLRAGWVEQSHPGSRYRPTGRVLALAGELLRHLPLSTIATPVISDLRASSQETVHLAERRGDELICVARQLADGAVIATAQIGERWPMQGTAVGTAMRAALIAGGRAGVGEFQADGAVRFALEHGYSVDDCDYRPEVRAVASAVVDFERQPLGAIVVSGPASRVSLERLHQLGELARGSALRISAQLGHLETEPPESRRR